LSGYSTADVGLLMPFLEATDVAGGTVVITHGSMDADVYFLQGGAFSVLEKVNINGSTVILNTASFSGPSILGEVNMLNQTLRTATVLSGPITDLLPSQRRRRSCKYRPAGQLFTIAVNLSQNNYRPSAKRDTLLL